MKIGRNGSATKLIRRNFLLKSKCKNKLYEEITRTEQKQKGSESGQVAGISRKQQTIRHQSRANYLLLKNAKIECSKVALIGDMVNLQMQTIYNKMKKMQT